MVMICPYCDTEINEKLMEAEDGCCPECGAVLTQSNILSDTDEDEEGGGYDDEDDDDYSAFGERSRAYDEEFDEFDEFLEEEEKLERNEAKNRNKNK